MDVKLIKTEEEYSAALERIDQLLDAKIGTRESDELELLSILVENYESEHHKIEAPNPIDAILFRAEQMGLTRKDLEEYIGPRGRVSDILNHKRKLTMSMIRKLHKHLNIPAEILIQEYR